MCSSLKRLKFPSQPRNPGPGEGDFSLQVARQQMFLNRGKVWECILFQESIVIRSRSVHALLFLPKEQENANENGSKE